MDIVDSVAPSLVEAPRVVEGQSGGAVAYFLQCEFDEPVKVQGFDGVRITCVGRIPIGLIDPESGDYQTTVRIRLSGDVSIQSGDAWSLDGSLTFEDRSNRVGESRTFEMQAGTAVSTDGIDTVAPEIVGSSMDAGNEVLTVEFNEPIDSCDDRALHGGLLPPGREQGGTHHGQGGHLHLRDPSEPPGPTLPRGRRVPRLHGSLPGPPRESAGVLRVLVPPAHGGARGLPADLPGG